MRRELTVLLSLFRWFPDRHPRASAQRHRHHPADGSVQVRAHLFPPSSLVPVLAFPVHQRPKMRSLIRICHRTVPERRSKDAVVVVQRRRARSAGPRQREQLLRILRHRPHVPPTRARTSTQSTRAHARHRALASSRARRDDRRMIVRRRSRHPTTRRVRRRLTDDSGRPLARARVQRFAKDVALVRQTLERRARVHGEHGGARAMR